MFWPFFPVIEIVDGRVGRVAFCARVRPGEEFVISFVHSVNRRPVHDTLRVEADHLVIGKDLTLEGAVNVKPLQLHPGAERYYKEKGLMK